MDELEYTKRLLMIDKGISLSLDKLSREKLFVAADYAKTFISNLGEDQREPLNPNLFTRENGARDLAADLKVGDIFSEAIMYTARTQYVLKHEWYRPDLVEKYPFLDSKDIPDILVYASANPDNMKKIITFFIEGRYFGKGYLLHKTDSDEAFKASDDMFHRVKGYYSANIR